MVNRIWYHHFGKGIVATPDDFGFSGLPPSHPELLDWLAVEFMQSGWSVKHIHRLIMLSSTYQQSSEVNDLVINVDPNNKFLSHQNMRRMDAETLRDCILDVAGLLELTSGGMPRWPEVPESVLRAQPGIFENSGRLQAYYTTPEELNYVRSILLVRKRSVPYPFLSVFNLSDASGTCGRREVTINAPQALTLLNNPLCIRAANHFAFRIGLIRTDQIHDQMETAFWTAFGRSPSTDEQIELRRSFLTLCRLLQQRSEDHSITSDISSSENEPANFDESTTVARTATAELCRSIFNSNEFIFIE